VRSLVRDWEEHNVLARARDLARIGAFFMPTLFLGDLLVLAPEHYAAYMLPKLAVVATVGVNLVGLELISRRSRLSARWRRRLGMASLLAPALAALVCYAYFLVLPYRQYQLAVVLANAMIPIFCTLALHRFWREQYIFNAASLVLYAALGVALPALSIEMTSLALVSLASIVTAFVYRREYFGFMQLRYENLCSFLPRPIARLVALVQDRDAVTDAFAARQRFAVILCADWRDFQVLATTQSPEFISAAFERFYDLVLEHLDRVSPEGSYFVDWNADELFVVFIGEPGGERQTIDQALTFAHDLGTDLFEQVRAHCGFDIVYDIGMAAGLGLIGLMGPRTRKKTTVAATAAGIAKRLETEAKLARKTTKANNPYPIIGLTAELCEAASRLPVFAAAPLEPVTATAKDIVAQTCFVWQASGERRARNTAA
jgi:class 3 adenylate cyclase